MQHAEIAPSSAPQWVYCGASVLAQKNIEQDEETTAEGIALHAVAQMYFNNHFTKYDDIIGTEVEGVIITWEMMERLDQYIMLINSLMGQIPEIEKQIDCSIIHPKCFGTPDYFDFEAEEIILTIADYKDGFGEVDSIDNWQLLCYMFGIVDNYLKNYKDQLKIRFIICQPRNYMGDKIKEWNVTYKEVEHHLYTLQKAAFAALVTTPAARAGLHCRHCLAKFGCKSFQLTNHELSVSALYNPDNTEKDMTCELEFLQYSQKMIGYRLDVLEAEALARLHRGENVQRYNIGRGRGGTSWKDDLTNLDAITKLYGIDIFKPAQRMTPIQVKALLKKKGLPDDALSMFSEYHAGKIKLIPVDPRKLQEIFKEK